MVDKQGRIDIDIVTEPMSVTAMSEHFLSELKERGFTEHQIAVIESAINFAARDELTLLALRSKMRAS